MERLDTGTGASLTAADGSTLRLPPGFVTSYHMAIIRHRRKVIALWMLVLAVGGCLAPLFLNNTTNVFNPPKTSPSGRATAAMDRLFPSMYTWLPAVIVVTAHDGGSVLGADGRGAELQALTASLARSVGSFTPAGNVRQLQGYYTFAATAPLIAQQFLSPDNSSSIFTVDTNQVNKDASKKFVLYLNAELLKSSRGGALLAMQTGMGAFAQDALHGVEVDLVTMDSIAFPLAMAVLASVIRSARLLVMPMLCIGCTVAASMGIAMYPISFAIDTISFAPSTMMSCAIAISIDYSLFLLSRYREELLNGRTPEAAVNTMLRTAGHTIVVSGTTLTASFLGLCAFPVDLLNSVGLGSAITVCFCMLSNLSLVPAMLTEFEGFFSSHHVCCCGGNGRKQGELEEGLSGGALSSSDGEVEPDTSSLWFRFGRQAIRCRWLVVVAMVALCAPFALQIRDLDMTINVRAVLPRKCESGTAYNELIAKFGAGFAFPYTLVIEPAEGQSVMSSAFFSESRKVLSQMQAPQATTGIPSCARVNATAEFDGIMYAGGKPMPFVVVEVLGKLDCERPKSWGPLLQDALKVLNATGFCHGAAACQGVVQSLCRTVAFAKSSFVAPGDNGAIVSVKLGVDPFGVEGQDWLDCMRALMPTEGKAAPRFQLTMGAAPVVDCMDSVKSIFPAMILATFGAVFVICGLFFRSVVVPLRAILTISMTLGWVYGFGVLTYQRGALAWLGAAEVANMHGVSWMVPVMSFTILVGLGLDYDIFLLTRILEFREMGYDDRSAVLLGLSHTGYVISAAGVIMVIAFGGLFLSAEAAMNELAFFLVFDISMDTFIIRTILVPCVMAIVGTYNFWPRRLPEVTKRVD